MKHSTRNSPVRIAAIGTAVPEMQLSQDESGKILMDNYGDGLTPRSRNVLQKVFLHPSIKKTSSCIRAPGRVDKRTSGCTNGTVQA